MLAVQKCVAICLGSGATGCTLAAVSTLSRHCFRHLPGEVDYPEAGLYDIDMDWAYGPAFFCMLLASIMQVVNVMLHVMTPTAKHGAAEPNNEGVDELLQQS